MIDRDEMLRLVRRERDEAENGYAVSQHGSEAVTVWRRRADVLLAIESFIRTAPDPEKVKRLVDAATMVAALLLVPPGKGYWPDELRAALADFEGGGK
jgi:hypothetical protein